MNRKGKLRLAVSVGLAASAMSLGLVLAAGGPSGATAPRGTITAAEGPEATPNYILPFYPPAECTTSNTSLFQEMMYRPLYWFGLGSSSLLQPQLSTGNLPKYSNGNRSVTITMKGWKFADGQTVNGEAVMFFLNMYKAVPTGFCTYTKGLGIPDEIASAHASGNTVVINLTKPVSPLWFTYNELATITPMANTWDRTSATHLSNCASGKFGAPSTIAACTAVQKYLNNLAQKVPTFPGTMWQSGVDGPWRLTHIDNLGNFTMVPNKKYSGPVKPTFAVFKSLAFTTATAEQNQLQAGNVDVGYVDPSVLTSPAPRPGAVGRNWGPLAGKYNLVSSGTFANNYMNLNFKGGPNASLIDQLYFRQALASSINQPAIIKNAFKNYAVPTWSALPPSTSSSLSGKITDPYPFSMSKAEKLLTSNGWKNESGQLVCTNPGTGNGHCGAGVTSGQKAALNIEWVSGSTSENIMMNAIVSEWTTLGIKVTDTQGTFNATAGSCPVAYNPSTTFDICNWGGGWLYAPDYLPTGEPLYLTGAGSNSGLYSNGHMNALIEQTITKNIKLTTYGQFTASNLPVLWDPLEYSTGEISKSIKSTIGWGNALENLTPEYWHIK
ncbi:MAG: ABC transporter substrate-binding protein [Acidimicrobiales bacterium]